MEQDRPGFKSWVASVSPSVQWGCLLPVPVGGCCKESGRQRLALWVLEVLDMRATVAPFFGLVAWGSAYFNQPRRHLSPQ